MSKLKKVLIGDCIILFLLLVALVSFIVGLHYKIEWLSLIASIITVVALTASFVKILFEKNKITPIYFIELALAFFVVIFFLIAYILACPEDNVRIVLATIIGPIVGGLLTLVGVGLTIKYNRLDKREEDIKKAKPFIFLISETTWGNLPKEVRKIINVEIDNQSTELSSSSKGQQYYIRYIMLGNSDLSICSVAGIMINDLIIKFNYEIILRKDSYNYLGINYQFNCFKQIDSISLLVFDSLDNCYSAKTRFEILDDKKTSMKEIKINSVLEIKIFKDTNFYQ